MLTKGFDKVKDACNRAGNCFVAGAQVVVSSEVLVGPLLMAAAEPAADSHTASYCAAVAFLVGAGLSLQTSRRSPRRRRRRPIALGRSRRRILRADCSSDSLTHSS
ncbi:MAG: hypothetical protein KDA89_08040 [Planctomycetaceae bacterium]|nr:hypothetical protein [Planctomycetaceae bacterium]